MISPDFYIACWDPAFTGGYTSTVVIVVTDGTSSTTWDATTYGTETITICSDDFTNNEVAEARVTVTYTKPHVPPPPCPRVLAPTHEVPRLPPWKTRPRARQGGIGIRNWHDRRT